MYSWFPRAPLRSLLSALIGSFLFVSAGMAQISDQQQQQFLVNPGQFLSQNFTNGGNVLASLIQSIASNPANLQTVINALASATPSQQIAIGAGLGQAATSARQTNPSYATQIQTAVVASSSLPAATGYSSASGGTPISSTGGPGGAGSGTGGLIRGPTSTGGSSSSTGGISPLSRLSSVTGGTADVSGLSSATGGTAGVSGSSIVVGGTDDVTGSSSLTGGTGLTGSVSPH